MENIDYIEINKGLIPYQFDITLSGITYKFDIKYNDLADFFTVNLYKNDEIIVLGEKLVYAKPLFLTSKYKDVPSVYILPYDLTQQANRINFENLNEQVFLFLIEGD